jgi:phospholipid/cholesterol/gamma-HCH transport system permease protein
MQKIGAFSLAVFSFIGQLTLLVAQLFRATPRLDRKEFLRAVNLFGVQSIPVALGAACLIGATVVVQAGVYANSFGARLYTGWAAGYALIWEFGPLLLGLVMTARIGARNAAEFGLLSVNGHLEGFRGLGVDLFPLLIAPRMWAQIVSVMLLSTITFSTAIAFESISALFTLHLPVRVFFSSFSDMIHLGDIAGGIVKTLIFGIFISLISTTVGLTASGGARGVGRAAALAVVLGSAAIFALDFFVTPILTRLFS